MTTSSRWLSTARASSTDEPRWWARPARRNDRSANGRRRLWRQTSRPAVPEDDILRPEGIYGPSSSAPVGQCARLSESLRRFPSPRMWLASSEYRVHGRNNSLNWRIRSSRNRNRRNIGMPRLPSAGRRSANRLLRSDSPIPVGSGAFLKISNDDKFTDL